MFQYKNEAQNITQIFGVNMKKYIGGKQKKADLVKTNFFGAKNDNPWEYTMA